MVNLACPHCNGLLEIDESLAGRQVSCPTCMGVVTIPSLSDLHAAQAPPPPPPLPGPFGASPNSFFPSPPMDFGQHAGPHYEAEVMQLACPLCAHPFSVTADMQGQEAHCPTCHGVVTIPMFGGQEEPPMYESPSFAPPPPPPPMDFGPPSAGPPMGSVPMGHVPMGNVASPAPLLPPSPGYNPGPAMGGYPGGNPMAAAGGPAGMGSMPATNAFGFPPVGQPAPMQQPMGANMPIPVTQGGANMPIPVSAGSPQSTTPAPVKKRRSTEPAVLIPTEDGGHVAVHEPVKTVKRGRQEIELRRLTPEEKAIRRRNMNLAVMLFGMIFLSIVAYVLITK